MMYGVKRNKYKWCLRSSLNVRMKRSQKSSKNNCKQMKYKKRKKKKKGKEETKEENFRCFLLRASCWRKQKKNTSNAFQWRLISAVERLQRLHVTVVRRSRGFSLALIFSYFLYPYSITQCDTIFYVNKAHTHQFLG